MGTYLSNKKCSTCSVVVSVLRSGAISFKDCSKRLLYKGLRSVKGVNACLSSAER